MDAPVELSYSCSIVTWNECQLIERDMFEMNFGRRMQTVLGNKLIFYNRLWNQVPHNLILIFRV